MSTPHLPSLDILRLEWYSPPMVNVPIELIELEAHRDGLKGILNIHFRNRLVNGYDPRSGILTIRRYKGLTRMAQILAHEIKHQIDLERFPWQLVYALYWPVILACGIWAGMAFGTWWGLLAGFAAYLFHPYELSANIYALRKWRRYLEILKGSE